MHRFLRAIGFSNIRSRQELKPVFGRIMDQPDKKKKFKLTDKTTYTEFSMEFGVQMGITLRGEYDEKGFFYMEHYFPYCESILVTSTEDITVNKRVDTNAFTGMCDDLRLGISMIFYLQNAVDYMELHSADNIPHKAKLTLSGLSLSGTILLGVYQDNSAAHRHEQRVQRRERLIAKAKKGDQNAIDNLTLEDIDTSAKAHSRIRNEDLYTLVETSFIPYGSESDHYSILGVIINWVLIQNTYTNEEVYQILLNCNDILITVCINKLDLYGAPSIGRRFKGIIWMQGHADFQKI